MAMVLLFDRKKKKTGGGKDAGGGTPGEDDAAHGTGAGLEGKAAEYMSQARAILLEANLSGSDVKEAQDIFKRALKTQKSGDYGRTIELALQTIDLTDDILKNV